MSRIIKPPVKKLVIPERHARPDAQLQGARDVPGRVTLTVNGEWILADMCAASSLSSHVVDGEDVIVLAFSASRAPVGLYQPLDLDDARGLAGALLAAVKEIEAERAPAGGDEV